MTSRRVVTGFVVSLLTACSSGSVAPPPSASATGAAAPSGGAGAAPSVATSAPTAAPTPPRSGPLVFNHFVSATPPAANTACPPVPRGDGPASSVARTLRRLACEPALFYKPVSELRIELALAADQELAFNGPASVTLSFPRMPATELATAMGEVATPMAVRSKTGAWSFRNWFLVPNRTAQRLDRWGPGRVFVGVAVSEPGTDVDVVPLGTNMTRGDATISMPQETLAVKDDDVAAEQLFAGLAQIASDERQLDAEPPEVAKTAALDDERFRLSRRAIGTGPSAIKGIDVWPARTRIAAAAIIDKLGLQGKIEPLRATDTDDFVLYAGTDEEHVWRGLHVVLRFRPREGTDSVDGYAGYTLTGVTLMP